MATSKSTTNYNLPIYAPDDVTSWLVTWNGAMTELDRIISNVQKMAEAAGTDVTLVEQAVEQLKTSVQQLNTAVTKNAEDITAVKGRMDTAEGKITALETDLATEKPKIAKNTSDITALKGLVGDGYEAIPSSSIKGLFDQ